MIGFFIGLWAGTFEGDLDSPIVVAGAPLPYFLMFF
jgi:hypothetical protein